MILKDNRTVEGRQYKHITAAIKSIDIDTRTVVGFASVFGNIDSYGDIVEPGAFAKTIKEQGSRIKHLWQHDFWMPPIATVKALSEEGRDALPEDIQAEFADASGGLMVERKYLDTERGHEVFKGIEQGAITEMSFAYDIINYESEKIEIAEGVERTIWHLNELRLWETSDVIWGANAATSASKRLDFVARDLEKNLEVLKTYVDTGKVTDFAAIETAINQLQIAIKHSKPDGTAAPLVEPDAVGAPLPDFRMRLEIAKRELDLSGV